MCVQYIHFCLFILFIHLVYSSCPKYQRVRLPQVLKGLFFYLDAISSGGDGMRSAAASVLDDPRLARAFLDDHDGLLDFVEKDAPRNYVRGSQGVRR